MYVISIIITSAPPQGIRHEIPEVGNPCSAVQTLPSMALEKSSDFFFFNCGKIYLNEELPWWLRW